MSTVRLMLASLAEVFEVTAFSMEIQVNVLGFLVAGELCGTNSYAFQNDHSSCLNLPSIHSVCTEHGSEDK